MDTIVIKFGGSSVADNSKLRLVASRIIDLYNKKNNIVVVVSAQGKTTDKLIGEAKELSLKPNKRELDVLLSCGEQITIAKLSILLNELGYNSISLTGWQAGIFTDFHYQNSRIQKIYTKRIDKELEKGNIVIVAGFQGINGKNDITTLGRGGSDTTAVALAAALNAKECCICSDVDGIYSADPNKIKKAKKIRKISYEEMINISNEGAKVLHNRCVEIGEKFDVPIIAKSTFTENEGTIIHNDIEKEITDDIKILNTSEEKDMSKKQEKIENLQIKNIVKKEISRISFIGNGINNNPEIIDKIMKICDKNNLEILNLDVTRTKISINFKSVIDDNIVEEFHDNIIG